MASTLDNTHKARSEMSAALPIGKPTTYNEPAAKSCAATSDNAINRSCCRPCVIVPIAALRSLCWPLTVLASVACGLVTNAFAQTGPAIDTTQPAATPAIALVLPNQQGIFAAAAEAVRQGFFSAHKASGSTA